jgi:hypothetical protein
MNNNNDLMPSLLDLEIDSNERDAFGHRHFAKALQSLVESQRHHPPYSIGLLGKWGTGKSSIKSLYLKSLRDDISRRDIFKPITFNAWRFGEDNIKRALLRHVYLNLGGDSREISTALFDSVQHTDTEPRTSKEIVRDIYQRYFLSVLQILAVFFVVGIVLNFVPTTYQWGIPAILGAVVAAGLVAFQFLLNPEKFLIARYSPVSRTAPPSTTDEQFETLLLGRVKEWKKSKEGKKCERIVVFVDDLDRLSAEEMVKGLDAVRTFMEIPKADLASLGIVFIISCDEERVAEALSKRKGTELPGAVFNRSDARRFLDRIFQFRLEIPLFPKQDLRGFALKRFKEDLPELVEELKAKNVTIENVVERLIHVDVQDPRNALQNINAFAQCWWLAKQREREGAGTNRQGGLAEGAVSKHALSLAALCALRVDYPEFYHDLQHTPDLLKRFEEVFTRDMPQAERMTKLKEQPETIRLLLERYWDEEKSQIKPDYRRLRQYIASLRGLRWPASLQPLLLLSQDPATRKRGDRAPRLMEAFVSGDAQGVLAELGRENDSNPLSTEDARLLRDLSGDLVNETEVRRDNAASVIAQLSRRLQSEDAPNLLSPLARRLVESSQLRFRVGVPDIRSVLLRTYDEDRRQVAAALIDDLLAEVEEIKFQTQEYETPTLDQAVDMVREAVDVALEVRAAAGLDAAHDRKLLKWLETRCVATGGKTVSLAFAQFEQWVDKYESLLLPALSYRYAQLVVEQLEADNLDGWDVDVALRRTQKVSGDLAASGEESRAILWKLLADMVAVKKANAVTLAWNLANQHRTEISTAAFNQFVQNFAGRALKDMDGEPWVYDWETASDVLIQIVESRVGAIEATTSSRLIELAASWSTDDGTANFSVRLTKILGKIDDIDLDVIWLDWSERLLANLPDACIDYFASQYGDHHSDAVQLQVTTSLTAAHGTTAMTEEVAVKFRRFLLGFKDEGIRMASMQTYLGTLFGVVEGQYANSQGYLDKVFPVIPPLIKRGPKAASGSLLHNLFNYAAGSPESRFDWLCSQMAQYWLPTEAALSSYKPQQIFNLCQAQLSTWSSKPNGFGLVDSMTYMVEKGLVDDSQTTIAVESACLLWPYHRKHALSALQTLNESPTAKATANLAAGTPLENGEAVEDLLAAWKHISSRNSTAENHEVGQALLNLQEGLNEEPDMALRLWFDAQGDQKITSINALLVSTSLPDAQRKRIWLQLPSNLSEMSQKDILTLIGDVMAMGNAQATQKALLDSQNVISSLFPTKEDRYSLANQLLRSFHSSSSQEMKNRLVAWMKESTTGDDGFLKEMKKIGNFSAEDITLLLEHFPKSKTLKKLQSDS